MKKIILILFILLFTVKFALADAYVKRFPSGTPVLVAESSATSTPTFQNIELSGASILANATASGVLTKGGTGGTYNENETANYESVANSILKSTTTGVTGVDHNYDFFVGARFGEGNRVLPAAGTNHRNRTYSDDITVNTDYIEMYHDQTDAIIDIGGGALKLYPSAGGDSTFFEDTDVGDAEDGKSLFIYRKAAEGDSYGRLYIEDDGSFYINSTDTGSNSVRMGTPANYCAITPDDGSNTLFYTNSYTYPLVFGVGNITLGNYDNSGRNPFVRMGGYITADTAGKYIQWKINDTTDYFECTRQDAHILGFDIQMPLITDNIKASAQINIAEISTPSAVANYGAYYTKTDNKPYFQDGAGNEHEIATAGTFYGGMYLSANSNATVIETATIPIMVRNCTTGDLNGFTFDAGSTGAITAYSDGTGKVNVASGTHGLVTGDEVSIRGTTDYNGVWTITRIDDDNFSIPDTWVNDNGASDWDEGSHLVAGTGATGKYGLVFNLSCSEGGGAGSDVIGQIYINSTACTKCVAKRKFSTNDYGNLPGTAIITIAEGDKIYFTLTSTGTNAITCQYGDLNIHRF